MPQELKIFDNIPIRTFWDEGEEKWYFCIIDIVKALTVVRIQVTI